MPQNGAFNMGGPMGITIDEDGGVQIGGPMGMKVNADGSVHMGGPTGMTVDEHGRLQMGGPNGMMVDEDGVRMGGVRVDEDFASNDAESDVDGFDHSFFKDCDSGSRTFVRNVHTNGHDVYINGRRVADGNRKGRSRRGEPNRRGTHTHIHGQRGFGWFGTIMLAVAIAVPIALVLSWLGRD